jgi:formylmethanofuran dehydrogenase subunit E
VYDRHALTVRLRPVTLTAISYERGDLALSHQGSNETTSIAVAYAVGIGVIDERRCERCDEPLAEDNPLMLDGELLVGSVCCR